MLINSKVLSLLMLLTISFNMAYAQHLKTTDSVAYYIDKLNYSSFGISNTYVSLPYLSFEAKKIKNINDPKKREKLLSAIYNQEKAISIHMLLTEIYEPSKATFTYKYHYTSGKIDYTTYTYNGLVWVMGTGNDSCKIGERQVANIAKYWKSRFTKYPIE